MARKRSLPSPALAFVTLTLIAPLVAGGVLVFVAATESPLVSADDPVPQMSAVAEAQRYRAVQVAIAPEVSVAATVPGQASGTVTKLAISPGDTVVDGQAIMTVDNRQVHAYVSASPLYRDIARPMSGADVRVAQRLLKRLGMLGQSHAVHGKVDAGTEAAIKAFNKKYGYGSGNGVLSLASLVWVGPAPVTVVALKVTLGASVAPGVELFDKSATATAIAVTETAEVPRGEPLELVVGDVIVPYVSGSGRVSDPEAVAKIAAILGAAAEAEGVIRLVTPVTVGAVPASAVVTDEAGRTCIFPDLAGAAVVVTPLAIAPGDARKAGVVGMTSVEGMSSASLGIVDLEPSLIGAPVLVNPRDVREGLSCG